jgi:hypothetical protein
VFANPTFDDVLYVIGTTDGCGKSVFAVRLDVITLGTARVLEEKERFELNVYELVYPTVYAT